MKQCLGPLHWHIIFHTGCEAADISLSCYNGLKQLINLFQIFGLTKLLLDISVHKETTETLELTKQLKMMFCEKHPLVEEGPVYLFYYLLFFSVAVFSVFIYLSLLQLSYHIYKHHRFQEKI